MISLRAILYSLCILFGIAFIIISVIAIILYLRTTYYINYLKECDTKTPFCYIKKIKLSLPATLIYPLTALSYNEGARVEISKKKQKNIDMNTIKKHTPEVIEWYKSITGQISEIIGTSVKIAPLDQPNGVSLVVYEKEGDYIDWHFDTNHYNGRFFTLLVPVTTEKTCGNYQYKDENEETQVIELNLGEAILFEGDKVFHSGKKLCNNQRRIILSLTFVTSDYISPIETVFSKIKYLGMYTPISLSKYF